MDEFTPAEQLRVLVVDDSEDDALLCIRELKRNGLSPAYARVDSSAAFLRALEEPDWDVILCDFSMPAFSGSEALALARSHRPEIPFIFVSGTIGEENAVAALQEGAQDYVIKLNLKRLSSAVLRALRFAEDRRERERLEEQLHQSQKMELVGQLTGGIAHDFNNMLTVVLGNLELLELELQPTPEQQELVRQALDAGRRSARLVRRLTAFSRRQVLRPKHYDLNAGLAEALPLLERTIGAHIDMQVRSSEGLWKCMLDPPQVDSAIANLAINARDAMPEGGILLISTENVTISPDDALDRLDLTPGDYVHLTVSDTGIGMAPDTLERAFEPFFTTKGVGQGSGLGLSMVYGFTKQSGGEVVIESEWDAGTTVHLYFPRAKETDPQLANGSEPRTHKSTRRIRILVVDDEPTVRRLVARVLLGLDHDIVTAEDGVQALRILRDDPSIELLFTDLIMPNGVLGVELARQAIEFRPELKVLFTSGNPDILPAHLLEKMQQIGQLLPKPWGKGDLANAIASVMDDEEF